MSEGAGGVFRVGRGLIGPSRIGGSTGEKMGGLSQRLPARVSPPLANKEKHT